MKKIWCILLLLFNYYSCISASLYWRPSTSGSGNLLWSTPQNWRTAASAVSATAPGIADVAIFDGTDISNCTIAGVVNVSGINMSATYLGTVTHTTFGLTSGAGNMLLSGGTFVGGSTTISCNGKFTLNGTNFISTSGQFNISDTTVFSSGNFTHNSGTVNFRQNATNRSYTCSGNFLFYNLRVQGNYSALTLLNPMTVLRDFTITSAPGNITVDLSALTVNNNILFQGAAAIILRSGALNALGNVTTTFTGDPYGVGTGTIYFIGTNDQIMDTQSPAGSGILPNIYIDKPSGILTLKGNISIHKSWFYVNGTVDAITYASNVMCPENGANTDLSCKESIAYMTFYDLTIGYNPGGTSATLIGDIYVAHNLTINNSSAPLINGILFGSNGNHKIYISGNWNGMGASQFIPGNCTVIFNGSVPQTLLMPPVGASLTQNAFYNLVIEKPCVCSNDVQLLADVFISNRLTMTTGNVNMNNFTLTLGYNINTGTLVHSSGWLYNGSFTRWFAATAFALGNALGHFPMGTATGTDGYYRPFWVGAPSGFTSTTGSLKLTHNAIFPNAVNSAFHTDATWAGGINVDMVSEDTWVATSANGLARTGNNLSISYGGNGFVTYPPYDYCNASLLTGTVGTYSASTNAAASIIVNRTNLSLAQLNNAHRIGIKLTPLATVPDNFWVEKKQSSVVLNWQTNNERNNTYFTIQRSADGINWKEINQTSGKGNEQPTNYYEVIDDSPWQGINYYQLCQYDLTSNTIINCFPVETIEMERTIAFSVFPNPAQDFINVAAHNTHTNDIITIENTLGQTVLTQKINQINNSITRIDLPLPKGIYFLKINNNRQNELFKFIKE